jgi:hypothetical protein
MSNILPVRFMTDDQYQELKKNGIVTSNGQTVTDEENALNLTPDTTDTKIEALNREIESLKDQLANVPKLYMHSVTLTGGGYVATFDLYLSKATALTLEEIGAQLSKPLAYFYYNNGEKEGLCYLMVGLTGTIRLVGITVQGEQAEYYGEMTLSNDVVREI